MPRPRSPSEDTEEEEPCADHAARFEDLVGLASAAADDDVRLAADAGERAASPQYRYVSPPIKARNLAWLQRAEAAARTPSSVGTTASSVSPSAQASPPLAHRSMQMELSSSRRTLAGLAYDVAVEVVMAAPAASNGVQQPGVVEV